MPVEQHDGGTNSPDTDSEVDPRSYADALEVEVPEHAPRLSRLASRCTPAALDTLPRVGLARRFARVVRYRDDKTADEADTIATVREVSGLYGV